MSIDLIVRVTDADWSRYAAGLIHLEGRFEGDLKHTEEEKRSLYSKDGLISLLYLRDDEVVGKCFGMPVEALSNKDVPGITGYSRYGDDNSVYLYSVAVEEGVKGLVGPRTLGEFIRQARRDGFSFVVGHTSLRHARAFLRFGDSRVIGEFPDWYGSGEDYVLFEIPTS